MIKTTKFVCNTYLKFLRVANVAGLLLVSSNYKMQHTSRSQKTQLPKIAPRAWKYLDFLKKLIART